MFEPNVYIIMMLRGVMYNFGTFTKWGSGEKNIHETILPKITLAKLGPINE